MENKVRYMKEAEVSDLTGLALPTLRNHRSTGRGLPYIRVGRAIFYSKQDVVDYFESHKIIPDGN